MHVIENCIQWNLDRMKLAKSAEEAKRYDENIKNLQDLMVAEKERNAE